MSRCLKHQGNIANERSKSCDEGSVSKCEEEEETVPKVPLLRDSFFPKVGCQGNSNEAC